MKLELNYTYIYSVELAVGSVGVRRVVEEWKGRDVLKGRYRIFLFVEMAATITGVSAAKTLSRNNFQKYSFVDEMK